MALIESHLLAMGTRASEFTLQDTVSGKQLSLDELKSTKATVIMFICNHCPFVKHVNKELVRLANDYMAKGISFIAISSNDALTYPADAPTQMHLTAKTLAYPFPYLYDENQDVAKAYNAVCTPDFYIFDKHLKLVYHGQLDASRPSNSIPVTGKDMRMALDNILQGEPIAENQRPSIGCSIKWKKQEPV